MSRLRAKKLLRERRKALREQLAAARRRAGERVEELRRRQRHRGRRRLVRGLAVLAILLLLLLERCSCAADPAVGEEAGAGAPVTPAPPAPTARPKPPPRALQGKLGRTSRATYEADAAAHHGWLDSFLLQVSARSPRLADCFRGNDKPGALRWTCAVNPHEGTVADHLFEPLGGTVELSGPQRQCLVLALTKPSYRLRRDGEPEDLQSTPVRVSVVIEF
jgi:hypothetical protein